MKHSNADFFPYKWRARFRDGSLLEQFPDSNIQNKFADLWDRRADIDYIEVTGLSQPLVVAFPPGADPVIFEKQELDRNGSREERRRFTVVGYKHKLEDKLYQVFAVIHWSSGLVSVEYSTDNLRD